MNTSVISLALVLLVATPLAYSEPVHERNHGPCFSVVVQSDRINEANVEQRCDRNVSRTVQAGRYNSVQTQQTGRVNDNKVRQYQHDWSPRHAYRKRAD